MSYETVTVYSCDRCGTQRTTEDYCGQLPRGWTTLSSSFVDLSSEGNVDICTECVHSLKQWFKPKAKAKPTRRRARSKARRK